MDSGPPPCLVWLFILASWAAILTVSFFEACFDVAASVIRAISKSLAECPARRQQFVGSSSNMSPPFPTPARRRRRGQDPPPFRMPPRRHRRRRDPPPPAKSPRRERKKFRDPSHRKFAPRMAKERRSYQAAYVRHRLRLRGYAYRASERDYEPRLSTLDKTFFAAAISLPYCIITVTALFIRLVALVTKNSWNWFMDNVLKSILDDVTETTWFKFAADTGWIMTALLMSILVGIIPGLVTVAACGIILTGPLFAALKVASRFRSIGTSITKLPMLLLLFSIFISSHTAEGVLGADIGGVFDVDAACVVGVVAWSCVAAFQGSMSTPRKKKRKVSFKDDEVEREESDSTGGWKSPLRTPPPRPTFSMDDEIFEGEDGQLHKVVGVDGVGICEKIVFPQGSLRRPSPPPLNDRPPLEKRRAKRQKQREERPPTPPISERKTPPEKLVDGAPPPEPTAPTEPPTAKTEGEEEGPLKGLLDYLPSDEVLQEARRLFNKDTKSLNAIERVVLDGIRLILKPFETFEELKSQCRKWRSNLMEAMKAVGRGGKFAKWINLSDGIDLRTIVLIVKHYAPASCRDYVDPRGWFSKIDRNNPCIRVFLSVLPKSFVKEAKGVWNDPAKKHIDDSIAFVDGVPLMPDSKKRHQSEFEGYARKAGIPFSTLLLIGWLGCAFHIKAYNLVHNKPMNVIVASRTMWKRLFDSYDPVQTSKVRFLGLVAHGQCWAMLLPLMNVRVHTEALLRQYEGALLAAMQAIAANASFSFKVPDATLIAHRFGDRMAVLSQEEMDNRMELIMATMLKGLAKGRAAVAKAWRAVAAGNATDKQHDIVDKMLAGSANGRKIVAEAYRAVDNKTATDEQKSMVDKMANVNVDDEGWSVNFDALKKFVSEHGVYPKRGSKDDAERKLGVWVSIQRSTKRKPTGWRLEVLEAFGFVWNQNDQDWNTQFEAFKKFVARHSVYPNRNSKDDTERLLGVWVKNQKSGRSPVKGWRRKKLDTFGFVW